LAASYVKKQKKKEHKYIKKNMSFFSLGLIEAKIIVCKQGAAKRQVIS